MKYVRTKDGEIFDITDWKESQFFYQAPKSLNYIFIDKLHIIDQSDNISDLCDEFAAIPLHDCAWSVDGISGTIKKGKHYKVRREELDQYKDTISAKTSELYAYIWGDNGDIIKVAKMNGKGELELL